ncbi:hypothetical protein BN1708_000961, partial [Verticillium longisporum]
MSRPESREVEIHTPDEEVYGLRLLQRIMTEAHLRSLSKLVVPILLIGQAIVNRGSSPQDAGSYLAGVRPVDRRLVMRCLDLGAADVILRPMHAKCVMSLEIHAHRVRKDAAKEQQAILEVRRGRKRSWVGVNEERPFAYLREAMVSSLMKGICRLPTDDDDKIANVSIAVSTERQAAIATAIGSWHFCAHDFSDDELLLAAMVMFKHALSMPQLERWRIPADQLINFLVACRAAYNSFVPYHNFRHVVDVLQATFNFLVHIGIIAPYPLDLHSQAPATSPVADLLSPIDGLTLLITAIGHDVGHPGVNNGFLVTLNAPLAQLYNDRSVLESFHCAAYSQILRRYWPAVFEDSKMRNLMISSILATDMGLHFDYMKKLGDLQAKLEVNSTTDGWNGRMVEEQKALACSLLIKCADISNVARKYEAALQWMFILSDEFSRQSSMENELEIQSSLLATPKKDLVSLAKAQLGFMNMFAIPLFQGVADIMPTMQYTVDELERNKVLFEGRVHEEQAKEDPRTGQNVYDVRSKCEDSSNLCYSALGWISEYLNQDNVIEALGAEVSNYESCNFDINRNFLFAGDWFQPFHRLVPGLLEKIPVLIYAGDADYICNWLGNRAWTEALEWPGQKGFNKADIKSLTVADDKKGKEYGKVKSSGNFTFMQIYGAGHMVPMDQPESSSDFFNRWLSGEWNA